VAVSAAVASGAVSAAPTAPATVAVSAAPADSAAPEDSAAPAAPRASFKVTPAMCRCYLWSLTGEHKKDPDPCGGGTTDSVLETFAEECLRAHPPVKDCPGLIACNNLEPSGYAQCLPGETYIQMSTCASCRCGSGP
jgi:hypothetical protein